MKKLVQTTIAILAIISIFSCKKYLDAKPNESLAIPETAKDLQALMDYYYTINQSEPTAGDASGDDYYVDDDGYNSMYYPDDKSLYIWERENLFADPNNDWYSQYGVIYFCNTVITKSPKIPQSLALDNATGQAYYYRGKCFFNLAQAFTKAYALVTADNDRGLPLRLNPDFNEVSIRATNQQTYQQILADIGKSIQLLPNTQITKYRPSKQAAYGLMARVYLTMGNFEAAFNYADSCLSLNHQLLDFNLLNSGVSYPITILNSEILAEQTIPSTAAQSDGITKIPLALYTLYQPNDLRKKVYFNDNGDGTFSFKGSYEGDIANFGGIAIDEIYLIRAEANVRLARIEAGLADLNKLLVKRYKSGTFNPYNGLNNSDALKLVLDERRKELLMRGLRWPDLKRLNLMGANITLKRTVNGIDYTLLPNSLRYALPLPPSVIRLSGMVQNPY